MAPVPLYQPNLTACFILQDRRKVVDGMALIAAFSLFSILLWLGCGQPLTHLPAYLRGALENAAGYNIMKLDGYSISWFRPCCCWPYIFSLSPAPGDKTGRP
jgi:hypothetical protein